MDKILEYGPCILPKSRLWKMTVALTLVKETIQEKKKGMVKDYENAFFIFYPKDYQT